LVQKKLETPEVNIEFLKEHELFEDIVPHILERFWDFHSANPNIFILFLRFAREVQAAGYSKYSIRAIHERIRWHLNIENRDGLFKMNDHHMPCYSRLLIILHPEEFENFFELRSPQQCVKVYKQMNYHADTKEEVTNG
jgi:hypothetical protein